MWRGVVTNFVDQLCCLSQYHTSKQKNITMKIFNWQFSYKDLQYNIILITNATEI